MLKTEKVVAQSCPSGCSFRITTPASCAWETTEYNCYYPCIKDHYEDGKYVCDEYSKTKVCDTKQEYNCSGGAGVCSCIDGEITQVCGDVSYVANDGCHETGVLPGGEIQEGCDYPHKQSIPETDCTQVGFRWKTYQKMNDGGDYSVASGYSNVPPHIYGHDYGSRGDCPGVYSRSLGYFNAPEDGYYQFRFNWNPTVTVKLDVNGDGVFASDCGGDSAGHRSTFHIKASTSSGHDHCSYYKRNYPWWKYNNDDCWWSYNAGGTWCKGDGDDTPACPVAVDSTVINGVSWGECPINGFDPGPNWAGERSIYSLITTTFTRYLTKGPHMFYVANTWNDPDSGQNRLSWEWRKVDKGHFAYCTSSTCSTTTYARGMPMRTMLNSDTALAKYMSSANYTDKTALVNNCGYLLNALKNKTYYNPSATATPTPEVAPVDETEPTAPDVEAPSSEVPVEEGTPTTAPTTTPTATPRAEVNLLTKDELVNRAIDCIFPYASLGFVMEQLRGGNGGDYGEVPIWNSVSNNVNDPSSHIVTPCPDQNNFGGYLFDASKNTCSSFGTLSSITGVSGSVVATKEGGGSTLIAANNGLFAATLGEGSYSLSFQTGSLYKNTPVMACTGNEDGTATAVPVEVGTNLTMAKDTNTNTINEVVRHFGFLPYGAIAWFQTEDADLTTGGSIISAIPSTCTSPGCKPYLSIAGNGGYPGVPMYGSGATLDVGQANVSETNWNASSDTVLPKLYNYNFFASQIPSSTTINTISTPEVDEAALLAGTESADGYTWFKYDGGDNSQTDLTITGDVDLGNKKVVLFVNNANLNISGNITLNRGSGFFMAVVGIGSQSAKGNIYVNPNITTLEGLYAADVSVFTGTLDTEADTQFYLRGSMSSLVEAKLQRDLGESGNPVQAAEYLEYAPDQILLIPPALRVKKFNWKEVAP